MNSYILTRCLHVNFVMLWMAGMFALPGVFVIHKKFKENAMITSYLEQLERKMLRYFINPCLILTFLTGVYLIWYVGVRHLFEQRWFQGKVLLLIMMFLTHGILARYRKAFLNGKQTETIKTYSRASILSMLIMVLINILVLTKPFM